MKPLFCVIALVLVSLSLQLSATEVKTTAVTAIRVTEALMIETTLVRGQIESPNTPRTAAKVAAEVTRIYKGEGMEVMRGQLLAELDDEAFKIAEELALAEVSRLQAISNNQQREVIRNEELFAKKLVSQSVLDNVLTVMKQLNAELAGANARLKQARYQLSHTKIVSPVNGIIQQRLVSVGDYVKVGKEMFFIVSTDKLRARIYLSDSLGSAIQVGMKVVLTQNQNRVTGNIIHIRPMMEKGNRALHALVDFDNKFSWKPITSIVAEITLKQIQQAITVPAKALVQRPAGVVLYKIEGNHVIEKTVTTGITQGLLVEITSGINRGDLIAVDGAAWLSDGAAIDIQDNLL